MQKTYKKGKYFEFGMISKRVWKTERISNMNSKMAPMDISLEQILKYKSSEIWVLW